MSLQEKFQICVPTKAEDGESWVSAGSQRDVTLHVGIYNSMPPGMDITRQFNTEQHQQPLALSGSTDVSKDTNPSALEHGFTKRTMKGCDDQYTGEHMDHFYGDAGGFVERNNYLDRE